MKITLIGDAHGKIDILQLLQGQCENSIQLGDVGFGFRFIPHFEQGHKFIRGNHDAPSPARLHPNYLGDYGFLDPPGIFFLSGAGSIDKAWRVPGKSWWEDEELSISELNQAVDLYVKSKPDIVLTHECPSSIPPILLQELLLSSPYARGKMTCMNFRTSQALQRMFEEHQPKLWVFGHYHITKNFIVNGTEFQCLAELDTRMIETNDYRSKQE